MTFALSVLAVGVGLWLVFRVHSVNQACSSLKSPLIGSGLQISCQNVLSYYFLGIVLTIGGLLVVLVGLIARAERDRRARRESATLARRRIEEHRGLRDAA